MTKTVHLHVFFDSSLKVDVVEHMAASATAWGKCHTRLRDYRGCLWPSCCHCVHAHAGWPNHVFAQVEYHGNAHET